MTTRVVRLLAVAGLASSMSIGGLAACSDETTEGVIATTGAGETAADVVLRAVPGAIAGITAYRSDVFMDMTIDAEGVSLDMGDRDEPIGLAEYDNGLVSFAMDMRPLLEPSLPPELRADLPDELTMEMTTDSDGAVYMRQSWLQALGDELPATDALTAALADGGWVRIDPRVYGIDAAELSALQGAQAGFRLDAFDDLLLNADLAVEDLGAGEVRGRPTRVFGLTLSMGELSELTSGLDPTQLLGGGTGEFGDALATMFATPFDVIIHIDDAGVPARIEMSGVIELDLESEPFTMTMWQATDNYDLGADDIEIEIPTDFVDITDDVASLFGG